MSVQVSLKLQQDNISVGIRSFSTRIAEKSRDLVRVCAEEFIREAKANCPVDTGKLRDSIGNPLANGVYEISPNGLSVKVGTKVDYALIVEFGIKMAYPIEAKGKALKFKGDKNIVFTKQVIHPAMQGKFFMTKAAESAKILAVRMEAVR